MKTNDELITILRKYAEHSLVGKNGNECIANKDILTEAADRIEEYSKNENHYDNFEPITHFFQD